MSQTIISNSKKSSKITNNVIKHEWVKKYSQDKIHVSIIVDKTEVEAFDLKNMCKMGKMRNSLFDKYPTATINVFKNGVLFMSLTCKFKENGKKWVSNSIVSSRRGHIFNADSVQKVASSEEVKEAI